MANDETEVGAAVSEQTKEADRHDSAKHGSADRMPTAAEEKAAERLGKPDASVAKTYKESIETGADVKGEGQID